MAGDSKSAAGGAARVFQLPQIYDNPLGWGPANTPQTALTVQLSSVPFAPFNKNDRLGRVSDWTSRARGGFGGAFQSRGQPPLQAAVASAVPGVPAVKDDDEGSFQAVSARAKNAPKALGQRPKFVPNKRFVTNPNHRGGPRGGARGGAGGRGGRGGRMGPGAWGQQEAPVRENSIEPAADWKLVEEIDLTGLNKVNLNVGEAADLTSAGTIEPYNSEYDAVTPKAPRSLMRLDNKQHFAFSTSEDPILLRLMKEKAGDVYATDAILSVLMAAARSVNSWDIVVRKEGKQLVLDKRADSKIDYLSVNENYHESQVVDREHMNHSANLALEATCIQQNLSQQLLDKEVDTDDLWELDEPNPFADKVPKKMELASVGYRYRLFNLGPGLKVVLRADVSGFITRKDEREYLLIRAVNEFDSSVSGKVDWRQKLETQSSAVLTMEMKNNGCRLQRYAAQMLLAGADHLRLGFVSRIHPKDNFNHHVLLAQRFASAQSFAQTIGVDAKQMWGNLRTVLQALQKQADGKYLLLKDAQKPTISVYRLPPNAFAGIGQGVAAAAAPAPAAAPAAAAAAGAGAAAGDQKDAPKKP